jgi:peptidoglycan/LPS O-acetylase OafA/YrhL
VSVQNIGLRGGTSFSHAWSLAVEDQFYLLLPVIVFLLVRRPRAAFLFPCLLVLMGFVLRWYLALQFNTDTGVAFRGFQTWIYYATWTRLDPLIFGVVLAAIEKFRPHWWQRLTDSAIWLWALGIASIACGVYLSDADEITVAAAVWQFPLIALGMAMLLVCAVSPRLPFSRVTTLVGVQLCVYAAAAVLFLAVERPFLQLRHRLTNRPASDLRPSTSE